MSLEELRARLDRAAVLLDFDGTLAPIVARPEDARPLEGATDALGSIVPRALAVAVITGRPAAVVRELLPVEGLRVIGLYGFEDVAPVPPEVLDEVARIAATEPGTQVEPKGASVAVHFRGAPDPDAAGERLRPALEEVAGARGFRVLAGKRVWELAPAGPGGKGEAVEALLDELRPDAALYAGDDLADLEAFAALDRAAGPGRAAGPSAFVGVKVAVLGAETPVALREAADVLVESPVGVLELLRAL